MDILLSTNNQGKIKQFKQLLSPLSKLGVNLLSLKDINYTNDIEETGASFEENSLIKAKTVSQETHYITLGEDSGLCVDALNGAPGIYTKRYGGEFATKREKLNMVLKELKGVKKKNRGATFVSVITIYFPSGKIITARGEYKGTITKRIKNINGGMAFIPIFKANGCKKVASNLTFDELISMNHRGQAVKNILPQLISELSKYQKDN